MDLGTNTLNILLSDSVAEAPNYEKPEYQGANLTTAQIVGNGTIEGNPTVDLIFEDEHGQKYIAMITGGLMQNLAGAIQGMKERTEHIRAGREGNGE
jgi:hypothetical protein